MSLPLLPSPSPPVASALPAESPRLRDPRWRDARDDDPLEKARLAVAVGAAELLAGVSDGGDTAETALAALPFADDAEIALGRLADRLVPPRPGEPDDARRRILVAILAIAGQPRRPREPLDPDGARRCGQALLILAADASRPRVERAIAVSAARALAERGYVDAARIPADLDPKSR